MEPGLGYIGQRIRSLTNMLIIWGGGLSSPHPLCCPTGSPKAAPCPVEEGCERHDQIPLLDAFLIFRWLEISFAVASTGL